MPHNVVNPENILSEGKQLRRSACRVTTHMWNARSRHVAATGGRGAAARGPPKWDGAREVAEVGVVSVLNSVMMAAQLNCTC